MSEVKVERVSEINETQYLLKFKDLWLVSEYTTELLSRCL